jgi:hypothetical protein
MVYFLSSARTINGAKQKQKTKQEKSEAATAREYLSNSGDA